MEEENNYDLFAVEEDWNYISLYYIYVRHAPFLTL
jgi:hypothetical protein